MSVYEPATQDPPVILARSPAGGQLLGELRVTPAELVDEIACSVRKVQPLWALLRLQDRARYVRSVAQAIIDEFGDLVELLAREQGRPRAEVATLELLATIDALTWIAESGPGVLAKRTLAVHRSMFLSKRARITYRPLGVIGVIGAGSAPFAEPLGQIAGALLAGNGVVFKPAPRAGLAGEAIARALGRAGLPEGLVAVIHGGAEVGAALAQAPVQKIMFTGSPPVGAQIAKTCASRNLEAVIECGGKDAMIVARDGHLSRSVSGALWAGFAAAGQARGSIERIYVDSLLAERFTDLLVAKASALVVGDPLDPATQVGPLSSARRREHVQELVADAIQRGAHLHCGGPVPAPSGCDGSFYAPAVLSGVTHEMRLMREPINGPVLAVMETRSLEQAIELANDCDFSLGASVWTADRHQALRVADQLHAGMVWLNDHLPTPMISGGPWAPAGGIGRGLGEAGLRACAQEKLITWDPSGSRGLWWGPYGDSLGRAAQAVAELRSARDPHREHAWRHGTLALARVGARALRRGGERAVDPGVEKPV
jgi:acyl-CoA reductase-like NAD-dependent aldehyde dehydrogenase